MISVIVPCYNVEKCVKKCIQSVLQQTYTDWELILVNDGSKDGTLALLQQYADSDKRIVVVDKQNEGVDRARFSGLAKAQGEYVFFIDADDWIDADLLQTMWQKAEETQADYVDAGVRRVMGRHGWIKQVSRPSVTGLIEQPQLFDDYYLSFFGCSLLSVFIWGKLYRKTAIDKAQLQPSGLKMGEDAVFVMNLFPHLQRIYILDYVGYNYRWGGMTTRYNPTFFRDFKRMYDMKKACIDKYHYPIATDFIRIEMLNVLKTEVQQSVQFKHSTQEEMLTMLTEELQKPMWDEIIQLKDDSAFYQTPYAKAAMKKDVKAMYDCCMAELKGRRKMYWAKKIASFFIR